MTRVGRHRTKHRDMPPGCRLIAGRWYVDATNAHLARVIGELTGGKRSMFLAVEKKAAREKYVRLFVKPLEDFAAAETGTVAELVALARIDLLPKFKSTKGRSEAERYLDIIGERFGSRRYARNDAEASTGQFLRKLDVQRFLYQPMRLDKDARKDVPMGAVSANRLVNVMHGMFRLAATLWGKTEYDPTDGVQRNIEAPREALPAADQFDAVYAKVPEWMQCAMLLARDYTRRRGEILGLSEPDVTEPGLLFRRGKPRKGRAPKVILQEWDEPLRAIVARLQAHKAQVEYRTGKKAMRLLVNEDGGPVTETGWNSAWSRAVAAAGIKRSTFHFHDLRAVRPSKETRERAQELLAHDDAASTQVYRRGPIVIKAEFKKAG